MARTALITGSGQNIGRAIALHLAAKGLNIVVNGSSNKAACEAVAAEVREAGAAALVVMADIGDREAVQSLAQRAIDHFGGVDVLVNNAAFQKTYQSLDEIPADEIARAFETNVQGLFYFSRAALPKLPAGGSIINTTSIQAYKPSIHLAPYSATKAGIANITLSLAEEAINHGVRVNAVAPGPVWTPLIPSTFPGDKVPDFGAGTLLGRPAQPAELAPLYVFLASPMASFITGEIYGVTGGEKQL